MKKGTGILGALALVLLVAFTLAAQAGAATRYAVVGGDDTDFSCPSDDPCDIQTAVEDVTVATGDRIEVGPGTHNIGSDQLTIGKSVNIVGVNGRPEIRSTHQEATVRQFGGFVGLENLEIKNVSGSGPSVRTGMIMGDSRIRRVEASGNYHGCWLEGDANLEDSICVGNNASAAIRVRPADGTSIDVDLTNVTGVAYNGFEIPGLEVVKSAGDGDVRVDVANSILQGGENAGGIVDVTAANHTGSGSVEVFASHSNFNQTSTSSSGGTASISAPAAAGNQTAEPAFVNEIGANYHQVASSPTVDAGDRLAGINALDIDSEDRNQGATVDIGADEFDVVPTLEFTRAPAEGSTISDTRPTFEWTSDEDDVEFDCKRPGVNNVGCTSPYRPGSGFDPPLGDGEWTVTIVGRDTGGNSPQISRTFTVDTVPPTMTITSGPTGETEDATPTFGFSASEPDVGQFCAFDNKPAVPCSDPGEHTPSSPLGTGPHQFAVYAADPAGNIGPAATRDFTVVEPGGDPGDPADPGDPGDPSDPGDPGSPGDPSDPGDPGAPTGPGAADTTPPTLTLDGKRKQSSAKKVTLTAGCDEACTVVARSRGKATIAGTAASVSAKKKVKLKPARADLAAGESRKLKLKFKGRKTKKLVKRSLRRGKKLKLTLRVKAADQAGNRAAGTFKVKVKA